MNYNPDDIEQLILNKLKGQIALIAQTELVTTEDFDEMIKNSFKTFAGSLFDSEKYSVKINKNLLKVNLEDKNKDDIQNIIKNDFEENIFFNSFQLLIPDYSFYLQDEKTFVLQFEVNDINEDNIQCNYHRIKSDSRLEFLFKAEKKDLDKKYHRGIYKNFRKKGFYETDIVVPLNDYNINKLKETIYKKGVLNLIYEINKINDDDDDGPVKLEEEKESEDEEDDDDDEEKDKDNKENKSDEDEDDNDEEKDKDNKENESDED